MRPILTAVGIVGRVPLVLTPEDADYLRERFIKNNHPKYHKYCDEWMRNITPTQLLYFQQEARRLGWEWKGLQGRPKDNLEQ